jgi:chemotaxis signal transduction protein
MLPIHAHADLVALGSVQHPVVPVELGEWFDPVDRSAPGRRHALVVPLRRRPIVFLVERIEQALENPQVHPVPAFIAQRLREEWALGVIALEDQLAVLIDLRAVARSVILQQRQDALES